MTTTQQIEKEIADGVRPVPQADIQIGDYVEILPPRGDEAEGGLPVCGTVSSYSRFGNMYTVMVQQMPHSATGSRLRKR